MGGLTVSWNPEGTLAPGEEPDVPTEWEVRFSAEGDGTRVDLEHRGWERLRVRGPERRDSYSNGWPGVLEAYAAQGVAA